MVDSRRWAACTKYELWIEPFTPLTQPTPQAYSLGCGIAAEVELLGSSHDSTWAIESSGQNW